MGDDARNTRASAEATDQEMAGLVPPNALHDDPHVRVILTSKQYGDTSVKFFQAKGRGERIPTNASLFDGPRMPPC